MSSYWKLTRNRYTRRLYEALADVGITVTRMNEFAARTQPADESPEDPETDVECVAVPATDELVERLELQFSIPVTYLDEEWVVVAVADGGAVGRTLVSAGREPYIAPLQQQMTFDGAYVRRVYVARQWRNSGIAGRLVRKALTVARTELGERRAFALIAPDNVPSRRVFEANGFSRERHHDYLRLFGLEYRRTVERR